ncbi:nuclear pore complex protein NUP96 [Magnolia sinica]|uniref:nuclear pore complex protein NUP96 n=1 Tax=Magnolia sinica TaxID=86752 RepID=UPI002657F3BF|nr:nuclear pore complex protein NUP96 [Magnolia sinica]
MEMLVITGHRKRGFSDELQYMRDDDPVGCFSSNESYTDLSSSNVKSQFKKRNISRDGGCSSCLIFGGIEASLPVLRSSDYFMEPSLKELAERELIDNSYCCRVPNFTVGRVGYGHVKFLGETDVRWLDLDQIVKFDRHEVLVYRNESNKPAIGQGLNKAAEVTLIIHIRLPASDGVKHNKLVDKLRSSTKKQGAHFISFDASSGEWKFLVRHFSRFGLNQDDEDDIVMEDATVQHPAEASGSDGLEVDEEPQVGPAGTVLSHSLPAHLGLDPVKMQEMRMLMFPVEEEAEDVDIPLSHEKWPFGKGHIRSNASSNSRGTIHKPPLQYSAPKTSQKSSPSPMRKAPIALLEYKTNGSNLSPPGTIFMTRQNKGMPLRTTKVEGFKLDLKHETPIANNHSSNIVDAALFMGRSFRVGWGPNGVLVHTGMPVGNASLRKTLSSVINIEKVAIDRAVRDENNKVKEELVDLCFASPLNFHKSISHENTNVEVGSFKLKLQKLVSSRLMLSEISRGYIGIIERQLDIPGLSTSTRLFLVHQVMVWELIKVLFSAKEISSHSRAADADDGEDMMHDNKDGFLAMDPEAYPFSRRAEFSYWLQESVCHRVQGEVSCLNESNDLEQIFLLLTGRQLDAAVELAASRGDVRMACLLSQAGGSMLSRSDMAQQLDLWRINGLDFKFIENDRIKLYELLAGNIQGALHDMKLDWKRYLGLLMWYQLPPDTSLPIIIRTYQQLLSDGRAPHPVPVYIDEGPLEEAPNWSHGDRFDLGYYLMLLHADEEKAFGILKNMFSAFSSTHDALDYHMIWHQRAVLEAVGAFSSDDLHLLDMSFVSQLLCVGQCHWAIYVVLHMPYRDDFPYLQTNIIREILFQYCETWSTQEIQRQFIEDLGVPSAWMHEALAMYFQYYRDLPKALEHYLKCANWQRAHSIFMTSVAHSLFSSSKHSEILRLAITMEEHKSEIADWDLGAGLYIDFFYIRGSLLEENMMPELDSLEKKNDECRNFFSRLNESLSVWGSKLPLAARATYSKMAEELCTLLALDGGEDSTREDQMSCFETMLNAPTPEDWRSCHLQDAVSVFTFSLSERAS